MAGKRRKSRHKRLPPNRLGLESRLPKDRARNEGSVAADPNAGIPREGASNELVQKFLANSTFVKTARVTDVVGGLFDIEVTSGEGGAWSAVYLPGMSHEIDGGGFIGHPSIGDRVLCICFPDGPNYILGHIEEAGASGLPSLWLLGPVVDAFTESVELSNADGNPSLLSDRNQGRPFDSLAGDWGYMSEDGATLALLKGCIAMMKATEMSQLQFHGADDLVKLYSRNFQHFSDLGEKNLLNDEGETTLELLGSGHYAEALGQVKEGDEIGEVSEEDPAPGATYYGLKDVNSTGNWRYRIMLGYLGGVFKMWVTQPSEEPTVLPEGFVPGVAEIFITEEGGIKISSTKEILTQKVSRIAVPAKQKRPDDPEGDSRDDEYERPSGTPEFQWDPEHPDGRAGEEGDAIGYTRGYDKRRISAHDKDWSIPQGEDIPAPRDQILPEENEVTYTETVSTFHQRDDGSIFAESGGLSSVELTAGGNLLFGAPKDIIFQAGRDIVQLAGGDVVGKARNNLDMTAAEGDVRLKAENNLHMFSKEKGILLQTESSWTGGGIGEAAQSGGIVLRTTKAPIALEAQGELGRIRLEAQSDLVASSDQKMKLSSEQTLQLGTSQDLELKVGRQGMKAKVDGQLQWEAKGFKLRTEQTGDFKVDTGQFLVKCDTGELEGAGPNSVKSSHQHTFETPHGEQMTEDIKPQLTADKTVLPVTGLESPTYDDPAVDSVVEQIDFSFRTQYGVAVSGDRTYEATWQLGGGGEWNWDDESRQGTTSWPGFEYNERYQYQPTGGASEEPGDFAQVGRTYSLP